MGLQGACRGGGRLLSFRQCDGSDRQLTAPKTACGGFDWEGVAGMFFL
jgi:hypothetical protein